ncbi:MAG: TetR/AcrR family transcriptional regulator [Clostridiales bacterium]|nr:TetR/AcrR family transcriptional regulator [Clostridiales bacterium]
MSVREAQKEQRKKEILYAGLDLFVRKGYAATKISDIAKKASMSVGLLFHYFDSKETLYMELVTMGWMGTTYPFSPKYDSAILYFETFTRELFSTMQKEPYVAMMFVLMAQAQRSEGTPEAVRNIANKVDTIHRFVPIIERGQAEGSIRLGDPLSLSTAFFCSIQGIAENYAMHPETALPSPEWIVDLVRNHKKEGEKG